MDGHPLKVTLPGRLLRRGSRWWWEVRLPGEDSVRTRPLKSGGAKTATGDRKTAEKIAFEMWEQAITAAAERRVKEEADQRIARLKAQFLEKVHSYSQVVESATAKAELEARARVEAEAKLRKAASGVVRTMACECCGTRNTPITDMKRIDSGQFLCLHCLTALRAEAERMPSYAMA